MHRVGGLEKEDGSGNVSYDPDNHQHMTHIRQEKIDNVALDIPEQEVTGADSGDLLVLSWGGTYGACFSAAEHCHAEGLSVGHAHIRWLNPFPRNLADVIGRFKKVLIPELNMGQLRMLIQAKYGVQCEGLNKIKGRPFAISELQDKIRELCG